MYYFSSHSSGCETPEGAIFLDFRTGKYLGVPAHHLGTLRRCISGWPTPEAPRAVPVPPSDEDTALLAELASKGLLTRLPPERPILRPDDAPQPLETLPHERHDGISVVFRAWMDISLVLSIVYVWLNLKLDRLENIILHIESLRRRANARAQAPKAGRLEIVVWRFRCTSLWLYSRKDACLFDSLVLTRYLYWHGIAPLLVFGVSTKPFSAHAWVQVSNVMLVDSAETALRTTPIFVA